MRSFICAAALAGTAVLMNSAAFAAGPTPTPQDPTVQPPVSPTFDWTGGYAGLQLGALSSDVETTFDFFDEDYDFDKSVDGTAFGVFGGYNWQMGTPWVYGAEAEYNWVTGDDDADLDVTIVEGGGQTTERSTTTAEINATAALRGRVGYAFDRTLVYGTAGLAYVDYDVSNETGSGSDSTSADNWGWTLGVGVEYAFTDQISGRLDYRYSDYDGDDGSWYEGDGDYDIDLQTSEVRVGLAFRF